MMIEAPRRLTVDDLIEYKTLQMEIKAIEFEIESLYYPVKSPTMDKVVAGRSNVRNVNDPTSLALSRIEARGKQLMDKKNQLETYSRWIQDKVDQMENKEVASIIRCHFLAGESWRDTTKILYGENSAESIARMIFKRWERGQK